MTQIPILRFQGILLVSIQVDLHDALIQELQSDLLRAIEARPARGVIIDISVVEVLDTFTARALAQIAQMAAVMGTPTVVCGMRPEIALTLMEMGFGARGFATSKSVDEAIAAIGRRQRRRRTHARRL